MADTLTILLVEDDPDVLHACEQALRIDDLPANGVGSAELALQQITRDYPGIIVSDIWLPGMSGMDLLR